MELEIGPGNLQAIRGKNEVYDSLIIDFLPLYRRGQIFHALKYSWFALKMGGKLLLRTKTNNVKLKSQDNLRLMRYGFYKLVSSKFKVLLDDPVNGTITAIKTGSYSYPDGFSIGIVFSGLKKETPFINDCIESLGNALRNYNQPHEVVISAPMDSHTIVDELKTKYPKLNLKHQPYNMLPQKRLLIGAKKNSLFAAMQYSGIAIAHCRIRFAPKMFANLSRFPFEVVTPQINICKNGRSYRYLDYCLLEYQNLVRPSTKKKLCGDWIGQNYLTLLQHRVPYIDGGLVIFNKSSVLMPPWNPQLAWGEAEDVDMSGILYSKGILIDYVHEIMCNSASEKFKVGSDIKNILIPLLRPLARFGLI